MWEYFSPISGSVNAAHRGRSGRASGGAPPFGNPSLSSAKSHFGMDAQFPIQSQKDRRYFEVRGFLSQAIIIHTFPLQSAFPLELRTVQHHVLVLLLDPGKSAQQEVNNEDSYYNY